MSPARLQGEVVKRRSKAGGQPVKTQRRNAATRKRGNAPKPAGPRTSAAGRETPVARLRRQRDEALAQQAATADVLRVISRSTFDLQTVLDRLMQTAARLCDIDNGGLMVRHGEVFRYAAFHGLSDEFKAVLLARRIVPSRETMAGRVLLEGKVVHVEDLSADADYAVPESITLAKIRTSLGVPLLREGTVVGTLVVNRERVAPFTERQIELLRTFADQAVIAIENVRLFEAELQRTRELSESLEQQTATAKVLQVISRSTFDLQAVLNTLTESAARLCAADRGAVMQRDGEVYRIGSNYGYSREAARFFAEHPIRPSQGNITGRAASKGRAIHIVDVLADPEYDNAGYQGAGGFRTVLGVPLLRQGTTIGVFVLVRTEVNPFTEKQIELVTTFADQAVIAIENARLLSELRESLEQQTATADILKVIASSPSDVQPVFDAIAERSKRLVDALSTAVFRLVDGAMHLMAFTPTSPEADAALKANFPAPLSGFIGGEALHKGEIFRVVDTERDMPRVRDIGRLRGYRSMLFVPLLRDRNLIGLISVTRIEPGPFAEHHVQLLQTFADQAVIAIENARLFEAEQQRTGELAESLEHQTASSEVLQVINASPGDLAPVFDVIVDKAMRLCDAGFGGLWIVDGDRARAAATRNLPEPYRDFLTGGPLPLAEAFGRDMHTRPVVHVADLAATKSYQQGVPVTVAGVELGGIRTYLAVPLREGGALAGVLSLYRKEVRPFNDRQIALVQGFAAQAEIAMKNARLLNETRESLEQQTATADVLRVISSSPGDLEPVFAAMLEKAARICDASFGNIYRWDGEAFHFVAAHNTPDALIRVRKDAPLQRPAATSPMGRLIASKSVVHTADLREEPSYAVDRQPDIVSGVELGGMRTVLFVPMLKEDELVGAVNLYRQDVRPFTDKQVELVKNFAAQAVIAIENTRLLSELRSRTDELGRSVGELRALGEVSQAVNSTLDLENVLETIVAKAVQLSGTEAGAIYVFDDLSREFHLRATYGMDRELIDALSNQHIGLDETNIALVMTEREPIQVADLRDDPPNPINDIVLRGGFRARLTAPLFRGDDIVGMLVVRRRAPGTFAQSTVDLIKTFAAQSAVAIQNARLYANVETRTRELAASLADLHTAQDRLIQTEKLASLGQLTAGIAHEIKNPLNFINNFSALSTELIDELQALVTNIAVTDDKRAEVTELTGMLRGNLEKVVQHGKRADSIVKNMLLHSRQGSGEHQLVDVNALVEESLNLAYHGARAEKQGFNITLQRSFDPAAGKADLFPQEITRVLLNLISNGFYAATKRKAETNGGNYEPTLSAVTKNLGDSVEIRIRDNGTGIPPEVKERMFNPFFTTKPAGEGTGLGLSLSHDIIVKQHAGSTEVDTEPGEFTEFRIVLPRGAAAIAKSGGKA